MRQIEYVFGARRRIGETFRGAVLLANMVEGGRTPFLSTAELEGLGFKVALFPGTGFLTAAKALRDGYAYLQQNGTSAGGPGTCRSCRSGASTSNCPSAPAGW